MKRPMPDDDLRVLQNCQAWDSCIFVGHIPIRIGHTCSIAIRSNRHHSGFTRRRIDAQVAKGAGNFDLGTTISVNDTRTSANFQVTTIHEQMQFFSHSLGRRRTLALKPIALRYRSDLPVLGAVRRNVAAIEVRAGHLTYCFY